MESPLQIVFKDMDSSPYLEELIRSRVERLERFHGSIISCRVVVHIPHRSAESGKLPLALSVEVNIPNHNTIVAKDSEERHDAKMDHTLVVNRVFEVIQRQLEQASRIEKGIVKHHESAPDTGRVVRLFPDQDYGFVEMVGGTDLYFSRAVVGDNQFDRLEVGALVQVTPAREEGPMGPQASVVRLHEASRAAS